MTNSPMVALGGQAEPLAAAADRAAGLAIGRPRPAAAALIVIGGFVALRLIAAYFIGLGVDESYSVAVARDLHLSYFDHPPMHYWIAHAVEPLFGVGRGERIPFIALFAGSSWLLFQLTRRLFGDRAGFWAVLALNLSGFFTVAAGSWVLPDGPLMFALLAAAAILAESLFPAGPARAPVKPLITWAAVGLCVGLAGLSKYQAALFCAGLGLFLISTARGRHVLPSPGPYLAAALALAVLSPVLVWNATHHWASFAFQAGRGAPGRPRPLGPLAALGGQAALLLPWIFAPTAWAAVRAARAGPGEERRWFCLMLAAPAIAVFTLGPLIGPLGLPHWSMPGWLFLFPLLGDLLAQAARHRRWPLVWAAASLVFVLVVGALATQDAATGWIGSRFPKAFPHGDPTAESIEWTQLRPLVAASPLLRQPHAFVAALKWNEAGKLDQSIGDLAPVALMSNDAREFSYRHALNAYVGGDALIIGRLDTVRARVADLAPYFKTISLEAPVHLGRDGHGEITIGIAEARGLIRPYGAAARSHRGRAVDG